MIDQIEILRQKILGGHEITPEEYAQLIAQMREGRMKAAAEKKKKKQELDPEKIQKSLDDFFGG